MSVLRLTNDQYAEHLARTRATRALPVSAPAPRLAKPARDDLGVFVVERKATGKERMQALGRLKPGEMNKTEARYAEYLEECKARGEVKWFKFEGLKFRLADNTFYTPDFPVMLANDELECREVKGYWTDDARVKIKVAADMYPMRFVAVTSLSKKLGGGWKIEDFS